MLKVEVSYTISSNGRTFRYFYGILDCIEGYLMYRELKGDPQYKDIKIKFGWEVKPIIKEDRT